MPVSQSSTPAPKKQQQSNLTAADVAAKKWAEAQAANIPALRPEQLKRIGAIISAGSPASDRD